MVEEKKDWLLGPGAAVLHWEVVRALEKSACGELYLVENIQYPSVVYLMEVLRAWPAEEMLAVTRFEALAQRYMDVEVSHVERVLDCGAFEHEGKRYLFYITRFVGMSEEEVRGILKEGVSGEVSPRLCKRVSIAKVLQRAEGNRLEWLEGAFQACVKALQAVHRLKLVHGGICSNSFLVNRKGEVYLSGLFQARLLRSGGVRVPEVMAVAAPGVARGEAPTAESDLYALAGVFYNLLTYQCYTGDKASQERLSRLSAFWRASLSPMLGITCASGTVKKSSAQESRYRRAKRYRQWGIWVKRAVVVGAFCSGFLGYCFYAVPLPRAVSILSALSLIDEGQTTSAKAPRQTHRNTRGRAVPLVTNLKSVVHPANKGATRRVQAATASTSELPAWPREIDRLLYVTDKQLGAIVVPQNTTLRLLLEEGTVVNLHECHIPKGANLIVANKGELCIKRSDKVLFEGGLYLEHGATCRIQLGRGRVWPSIYTSEGTVLITDVGYDNQTGNIFQCLNMAYGGTYIANGKRYSFNHQGNNPLVLGNDAKITAPWVTRGGTIRAVSGTKNVVSTTSHGAFFWTGMSVHAAKGAELHLTGKSFLMYDYWRSGGFYVRKENEGTVVIDYEDIFAPLNSFILEGGKTLLRCDFEQSLKRNWCHRRTPENWYIRAGATLAGDAKMTFHENTALIVDGGGRLEPGEKGRGMLEINRIELRDQSEIHLHGNVTLNLDKAKLSGTVKLYVKHAGAHARVYWHTQEGSTGKIKVMDAPSARLRVSQREGEVRIMK